jgi:hypothetical protein
MSHSHTSVTLLTLYGFLGKLLYRSVNSVSTLLKSQVTMSSGFFRRVNFVLFLVLALAAARSFFRV